MVLKVAIDITNKFIKGLYVQGDLKPQCYNKFNLY